MFVSHFIISSHEPGGRGFAKKRKILTKIAKSNNKIGNNQNFEVVHDVLSLS